MVMLIYYGQNTHIIVDGVSNLFDANDLINGWRCFISILKESCRECG